MEHFLEQVRTLIRNKTTKSRFEKLVEIHEKRIPLKEMREFMKDNWGITRSYRSKKQTLRIIGTMILRSNKTTFTETKKYILENLIYEEEVDILLPFYTQTSHLSSTSKSRARKLLSHIVKDTFKTKLGIMLTFCGVEFSYRQKSDMLELILLCLFEKPEFQKKVFNDMEEKEDCPICTESVEEGVKLKSCPCTSYYHQDCLETWLKTKSSCPTCRMIS